MIIEGATITRVQTAQLLGVSYNGVRKMEARGELTPKHEVRNGIAFVVFALTEVQNLLRRRQS